MPKRVAVIGAGPMGLACALELLKAGHRVDIFEADDRVGGMTAHFDFDGLSLERYYHFICKPDQPMFDILAELGLTSKLKWRETKMGYYYNGRLYDWGNPVALLRFKPLSLFSRLRYGLHMFLCTKRKHGDDIDHVEASVWIKRWVGQHAYDVLWKKLFLLKFHRYANNLSASWIWARIRRVGQSRKDLFHEELGYLEGGSVTLLNAYERTILDKGGQIHLSTPVTKVVLESTCVRGVQINDEFREFDEVISTVPLPFVPRMIPDLPENIKSAYQTIQNIGVVCVLFKLRQAVTRNFWLNINDENLEVPGIIEISNLRHFDDHIVYVPFYLPRDNPKYSNTNEEFKAEARHIILAINPRLTDSDIIAVHVSRYGYAQPICPPGFMSNLPPIHGEIKGLRIADTSYYYPEDRSISESVALGKTLAEGIR